jgi:hypothetical protein
MNIITPDHIISAIVGYWRCGATLEQICVLKGIEYYKVVKIIENYQKQLTNDQS